MANQPQQALDSQTQTSEPPLDDDESDLEKLKADVGQMAEKIREYRATLPDQLKNTLSSILAAQRPLILTHFEDGLTPGHSADPNQETGRLVESGTGSVQAEEDQETAEKLQLLRQKFSSNAFATPVVLKRMKDCMSRIGKLESCNETIHPVFKRKRSS